MDKTTETSLPLMMKMSQIVRENNLGISHVLGEVQFKKDGKVVASGVDWETALKDLFKKFSDVGGFYA